MHRQVLLAGLFCLAQAGQAEVTAYGYDAFGRLVTTGHLEGLVDGLRTGYNSDPADNRQNIFARDVRRTLMSGQILYSPDSRFGLVMQTDGNLVLYFGSTALCHAGTFGSGANRAIMQSDGHLVVYRPDNSVAWSSGIGGNVGAVLDLQNDGNLVIYDVIRRPIWATGTGGH